MSNHVELLGITAQYEESESLAQRVYDTRKRVDGPKHELTTVALAELAFALVRNDKYERALAVYQTLHRHQKAELGDDHAHTKSSAEHIKDLKEIQKLKREASEGSTVSAVGARVELRGLSRAELNGTLATIVSVPEGAQARYAVKLTTGPKLGKDILVRRENFFLRCAYTECSTGKEATLTCSRCTTERYCCQHCQKAHWPTHRLACSPAPRNK
jgi:hypothetical protein